MYVIIVIDNIYGLISDCVEINKLYQIWKRRTSLGAFAAK